MRSSHSFESVRLFHGPTSCTSSGPIPPAVTGETLMSVHSVFPNALTTGRALSRFRGHRSGSVGDVPRFAVTSDGNVPATTRNLNWVCDTGVNVMAVDRPASLIVSPEDE